MEEQRPQPEAVNGHFPREENPAFLKEQILTYLGNKRALLHFIGQGVERVRKRLGRETISCVDLFAGSGIVARYLKRFSSVLYVNDLEPYSTCMSECYLANKSQVDMETLQETLCVLKREIHRQWAPGWIAEMYAPQDDEHIRQGERVFYTRRNAIYIDTARRLIDQLPEKMQHFLLAPLLYSASVHNNTAGVFKGFYKNRAGIGQFGGEGKNSLPRILGEIEQALPVFSSFECEVHVLQQESRDAARSLPNVDFCYMDPPYNEHPYGSNYFMLNLILENRRPASVSPVSGIPESWNRSAYNKPQQAREHFFSVIRDCPAKFILISYNSEGFIQYGEFADFLRSLGRVSSLETDYNTFRGCRNLRNRPFSVKEYLFLLERR